MTPAASPVPPEILTEAASSACRQAVRTSRERRRGAALLSRRDTVHTGSETVLPDGAGTLCAERAALYAALLAGHRRLRALLVRAGRGSSDAGPPCGACLQVLSEFAPDLVVFWGTAARPRGGVRVRDLLPRAFGPVHLRRSGPRASGRAGG